jgi:hypothetical protein
MGWTVRGLNPSAGEIFFTCPDRHCPPPPPPSFPYSGCRVSFPGVKRPGHGVDHPPPSSAEVKERVQLYRYSRSGSSWPGTGRALPFTFYSIPLSRFTSLTLLSTRSIKTLFLIHCRRNIVSVLLHHTA